MKGKANGRVVRPGDLLEPGTYQLTLDPSLYEPLTKTVQVHWGRRNRLGGGGDCSVCWSQCLGNIRQTTSFID